MKRNSSGWNAGVEHAALSDVGLTRANNQDSFAVSLAGDEKEWQRQGHLFVVADGMGAHAAGELASGLAIEVIQERFRHSRILPPHQALGRAISQANADIYRRGQASDDCRGMGTTVSALVLAPHGAFVGHVGDSRVYRLREGRLEQLTFDHSLAWEVCAAEGLPFNEVPNYVPRNVITRSVGPHPDVQVDLEGPHEYHPGDVFLLCSDGLSGLLGDKEIGTVLGCLPPEEAARVYTYVRVSTLSAGGTQRLGAGPYTATACPPDERFATVLSETAQQLQDVAAEQGRSDDFGPLHEHAERGTDAVESGDFDRAVREYCHGIIFAVGKLTNQGS